MDGRGADYVGNVSTEVQPIQSLKAGSSVSPVVQLFQRYPWVLPICRYDVTESLLASLGDRVITPVEKKVLEMRKRPGSP